MPTLFATKNLPWNKDIVDYDTPIHVTSDVKQLISCEEVKYIFERESFNTRHDLASMHDLDVTDNFNKIVDRFIFASKFMVVPVIYSTYLFIYKEK
jgi:hypothetical protein